jgi:NitT/TauT family transport system permease protein
VESPGQITVPVVRHRPHGLRWPPPRAGGRTELWTAAGIAGLFAAWACLARLFGPHLVPDPATVGRLMWADTASGALPHHLAATLVRVLAASIVALAAGAAAGVWTGLSSRADAFWAPWLVTALTVPRLLLIVVAYLLLGLNDAAAVAATALATAPGVAVALREGVRAVDWRLVDMAHAFNVPRPARWRRVIWPQLLPYVAGSARNALSLSWKMVLFAELMGRSSGVGYQIAFYFQMFDMGQILAYGGATIAVAAILEMAMRRAERRAYRWRPEPTE